MTRGEIMQSFEEEALARAQQMHKRAPHYAQGQRRESKSEKQETLQAENPVKNGENQQGAGESGHCQNSNGLLDAMFKNREQSLILLLIVLLTEENAEPSLLLALMYLLI